MADTKPSLLAPYEFHGLSFSSRGNESVASCPFCLKDDSKTGDGHFFVNKKTGQFSCKHCGKEGNTYTFLSLYHQQLLKGTKKDDWQDLSRIRANLPWQVFREFKLAVDPVGDRWIIPVSNGNGHLSNLLACQLATGGDEATDIGKAYGTTGCALHLIGPEIKSTGPIYIVEGPWKVMALTWLFDQVRKDPGSYSIVGLPGANTFKKDWIPKFQGRDVIFLLDNDSAGGDGTTKASKYLKDVASSQSAIQWPATLPDGYDLRDFICERLKAPKRAWIELGKLIHPISAGNQPAKSKRKLVRRTFFSVLGDFRHSRTFKTSKTFEDALIIIFATVFAAKMERNPSWLFLVGPPSVGKTLLIHSFLGCPEKCHFLSQISRSALVSGWRTPDGEDPSLLPKLNGKCLFIEDYTTVKSLPAASQDELYGLLRAAYNGKYDHPFGNNTGRNYEKLYFSMVAGVTNIIYRNSHALEGERFLKLRMGDDADRSELVRQVLLNHNRIAIDKINDAEERLRESVAAFLDRPFDPETDLPTVPRWFIDRVVGLCQVAATLRAIVERKGDELLYRPEEEFGTRLGLQLTRISRFIAYVLGKTKIDREVYRLIQRLALDTVVGFNLEVIHTLVAHPHGCILDDIGSALQLSHTTVSNRLRDLQELRAVYKDPGAVRKNLKGKARDVWHLNPELRALWRQAEITYTPPVAELFKRNGFVRKSTSTSSSHFHRKKTKKRTHIVRTKKRARV